MSLEIMPHNGQMLAAAMVERRFSSSQLGRAINKNSTAVNRLIAKPSIFAGDLWTLSTALGINLLDKLAIQHPIHTPSENEKTLQQRIADLEKEVAIYKDLLKAK